jgi:Lrp/AsnC family transcriptional regulator for asnA, asnC and gidA
MKKDQIIVGATTHIDYKKSGLGSYVTFSIKMDSKRIEYAINKIKKLPGYYIAFHGPKNYLLTVGLSIKESSMDEIKRKLYAITLAEKIESQEWLEVKNIPQNLSITYDKSNTKKEYHEVKTSDYKLDEIDYEIVNLLSTNGRLSFRKIAYKLGKSQDTIAKRYKRLVKLNLMKTVIQINPLKLGYKAWMIFSLSFSAKANLEEKIQEITSIPDVIHLVKTRGKYDFEIYAFVKDLDQSLDIHYKIAYMDDLLEMETTHSKIFPIWPTPKQYKSTF